MVLAAKASNWMASPARASAMAALTVTVSWRVPRATTSSPRYRVAPSRRSRSPSRTRVNTSGSTSSTRGMPASTIISGPWLG